MVEIVDCDDWTNPVQIRIRDGRVEIRNTVRMGGLSQAFYIDDEADDDPQFWINLRGNQQEEQVEVLSNDS